MTIRKLNFTNRIKIGREFISITTRDEGTPHYRFEADLNLASLNFPAEARVILEAYYQTERQRFDFGTVGRIIPPPDRSLTEFLSFSGVNFRLMVISVDTERRRIIGVADRLEPNKSGEKRGGLHKSPILPVEVDGGMTEAWKLNFEHDQPILLLNRNLENIKKKVERDSNFRLLIFPQIIRQIIHRMIYVDNVQLEDEEGTYSKWIVFLERYAGPRENWPETNVKDSMNFDADRIEEWTDVVVEKVCSANQLLNKAISGEGGDSS